MVEAGRLRGLDDDTSKLRQPDEDTMKKILGELYGDRKYLHKLQTDLRELPFLFYHIVSHLI